MMTARPRRSPMTARFARLVAAWNDLLKQLLAAEAMSGTLGDVERRLAKDRTALLHPMLELYIGARSALEPPIEVVGAARTCARARGPSKLFIGFPSSTGIHDMKIRHIAIAILTMVIWALSFTVIKIGLRGVPPLMICALRLFLVSLPWVIIIKRPMVSYHKIVACGVFMFLMQLGFMTCGMYAGTSAGLSAVIMQAQIPFTIVLAVIFLNEKPSAMQSVGALIALGGIIFLASNIGGDITAAGFLLTILAAASQASSNIIVRGFGKVNVVALIIWSSLFAWPPLLVMSLILEGPDRILQSTLHMSW